MALREHQRLSRSVLSGGDIASAVVLAGTVAGILGLLALAGSWVALLVVASLAGMSLLAFGPARWLPGLAIAAFTFLPLTYMPQVNTFVGRYIGPAVVVLVVWLIRSKQESGRTTRIPSLWLVTAGALVLWSILTLIWSIDPQRTLLWILTLCAVVILPVIMVGRSSPETSSALSKTWLWIGFILGSLAIVEGLTQQSFLADLYRSEASTNIGVTQNWSTIRVTTTLGHPLMNATFFATTSAYAIIHAARERAGKSMVVGAVCAAATVFTVSRSGVAALAIALLVGVAAIIFGGRNTLGKKILFATVATGGALAVMLSPAIQARSDSAEGTYSAFLRDRLLAAAFAFAADDNYVGSGAGTSGMRSFYAGMALPLENSYAGVLVSVGVLGLVLLGALIVGAVIAALRRGRVDAAAGIVAFGVQIAAYPLIDNVPVALLMFGMLAYLAFAGGREGVALRPGGCGK